MPWLTASAGTPSRTAARAAPTVPDTSMTGPRFWPSLMPEMTRSGVRPWPSNAARMVSAGKPSTAVASWPPAVWLGVAVSWPSVALPPVPLCWAAGATTVTSTPSTSVSAATRASMPAAPTPSSLVTRTCRPSPSAAGATVVVVASVVVVSRSPDRGMAASSSPPHPAATSAAANAAATRRVLRRESTRSSPCVQPVARPVASAERASRTRCAGHQTPRAEAALRRSLCIHHRIPVVVAHGWPWRCPERRGSADDETGGGLDLVVDVGDRAPAVHPFGHRLVPDRPDDIEDPAPLDRVEVGEGGAQRVVDRRPQAGVALAGVRIGRGGRPDQQAGEGGVALLR